MTLPDNRLRFSAAKIDFETEVGVTGQDHDTYPGPGQQPRFDWMRMFLIALLSSQSSHESPTEFRDGTLWFDLSVGGILKIRLNDAWVSIANVIQVDTDEDNSPITLAGAYSTIQTLIGFKPTASFGGHSSRDGVTAIEIPTALRSAAGSGSHPFVWVDGLLIDPRKSSYVSGTSPTSISLSGGAKIDTDQTFTVIMMGIESNFFSSTEVVL